MIILLILFTPLYAGALFWCLYGLSKIEGIERATCQEGLISVIIPFRNEGDNLFNLFNDLVAQQLPAEKFEVIWVNDHSEDDSLKIIQSAISGRINQRIINLEGAQTGKKEALRTGIEAATGDLIVSTDADCRVPVTWLSFILSAFIRQKADFLILPVTIYGSSNFAESFQQLENFALQGVTFGMASNDMPVSCNGANLAFSKVVFNLVGGYQNHLNVASGDDLFLLNAVLKAGKKVGYCWQKEVLVSTNAHKTWQEAIHQRLRWAGKMSRVRILLADILGAVLIIHALLICLNVFWLLIDSKYLIALAVVIGVRVAIDALLIKTVSARYGQRLNLLKLAVVSALYWIYLPVVAVASKLKKVSWKGREI